jgi:hypothetical protein
VATRSQLTKGLLASRAAMRRRCSSGAILCDGKHLSINGHIAGSAVSAANAGALN